MSYFILLNEVAGGKRFVINTDAIRLIQSSGPGGSIVRVDENLISVKESPESIYEEIKKVTPNPVQLVTPKKGWFKK